MNHQGLIRSFVNEKYRVIAYIAYVIMLIIVAILCNNISTFVKDLIGL